MGWTFPWASSDGGEFNIDFQIASSPQQLQAGLGEYNFRAQDLAATEALGDQAPFADWAATTGTDWATYTKESPGMSAFVREDDVVYHTYSAYARGLDGLWGMYQWLDRTPRGRNEARADDEPLNWFKRHDEYDER